MAEGQALRLRGRQNIHMQVRSFRYPPLDLARLPATGADCMVMRLYWMLSIADILLDAPPPLVLAKNRTDSLAQ